MKKRFEKFSFAPTDCPVRQVLDRFGDKWSILVIMLLETKGKMRFNEISQEIEDISQKMLTVTLRSLEGDGLLTRKHYAEIPPRVEYELTTLGKSLVPLIDKLAGWANTHMDEIIKNRKKYTAKKLIVRS